LALDRACVDQPRRSSGPANFNPALRLKLPGFWSRLAAGGLFARPFGRFGLGGGGRLALRASEDSDWFNVAIFKIWRRVTDPDYAKGGGTSENGAGGPGESGGSGGGAGLDGPQDVTPVAQPMKEVEDLLKRAAAAGRLPLAECEVLLERLEITPGGEDALFLLVRRMAKDDKSRRVRFGAFFDPLDRRPSGSVVKNAQYAYDEYMAAGANPEAQKRLAALKNWLATPAASGVAGVAELKKNLK
jgi:hypothetical protein